MSIRLRLGQGILETTIAIGVITTGLFAVITLVFSNSRSSDEAELRFSAVQLAREGIEVVRAKRDSNWLAGSTWDAGIINGGAECSVRVHPLGGERALFDEADDAAVVRRMTDAQGKVFWAQGTEGDPTPFRRLVTLTPAFRDPALLYNRISNPVVSIRARSVVQWSVRGQTKEVAVEEQLYDWR